ncbi:MAG: hypothetical protein EON54_03475 [Alcaligenaceae bacterium]|nr:MAG: hypothetical protein EON54_03475 [Alcaligenaceae bacterium]
MSRSKSTTRWAAWAVVAFGTGSGSPTRAEVLILVTWLFNGAMGLRFLVDALLERRLNRLRREAALSGEETDTEGTLSSPATMNQTRQ